MTTHDDTIMIDAGTLASWMQDGHADLYDVREEPEYRAERISGSVPMPLSQFNPATIHMAADRNLVFHCKSGVRCGIAARILRTTGFTGTIYRLDGGILAWKAAGMKTEPDDGR